MSRMYIVSGVNPRVESLFVQFYRLSEERCQLLHGYHAPLCLASTPFAMRTFCPREDVTEVINILEHALICNTSISKSFQRKTCLS